MEKPLTIKAKEFEESLVKIINDSNLPAFVILNILEKASNKINEIDKQEIESYYIEANTKKGTKKGSDK